MVALQNDDYWYFLAIGREHGRRVIRLRQRAGGQDPMAGTIVASQPLPGSRPVELRIAARGGIVRIQLEWRRQALANP